VATEWQQAPTPKLADFREIAQIVELADRGRLPHGKGLPVQ